MHKSTKEITELILTAAKETHKEPDKKDDLAFTKPVNWPVECLVGPGLEGAIACESKIGYVNGQKGSLVYRGYDIFDLCAYSTFEEVSYLLLFGELPSPRELANFKKKLISYRNIPQTVRSLMNFPVEKMNAMAALRLGTNLMRLEFTYVDRDEYKPDSASFINLDEDSIPMETVPKGESHAIYEFKKGARQQKSNKLSLNLHSPAGQESCYQLISGVASLVATISRLRHNKLPISPDPALSHAANLLYMITGRRPAPLEERIMDVCLILHADHGMNASTFATMVVASTLSDIYFAVGSGIAALNGPLHGGANEEVLNMLGEIGAAENVKLWYEKAREKKRKIMGFGHRVYKAYDPRARILGPLAEYLVKNKKDSRISSLFSTAKTLEKAVVETLGEKKKIFPNVDFYSGIVYSCSGIASELFTPVFAASRVSGWGARVLEYLENNRIFRPRAVYIGPFGRKYAALRKRSSKKKPLNKKNINHKPFLNRGVRNGSSRKRANPVRTPYAD
ncbi:MAG: citrate/2-methylcitrate synthase [Candidatus Omnitrophota bacterium]